MSNFIACDRRLVARGNIGDHLIWEFKIWFSMPFMKTGIVSNQKTSYEDDECSKCRVLLKLHAF